MPSPVRLETFQHLGFDAGILLKNFDYSGATNAATLAALITAAITDGAALLGATKGGINVVDTPEVFAPELDGMRRVPKGARRKIGGETKVTCTLVELTPDNFVTAIGAADSATSGSVTTVTPRADFTDDDYLDHLVWVGEKGKRDGYILVELDNVINLTGLNLTNAAKENGTIPVELTATPTDPSSDTEPFRILHFADDGATVAPNLYVYSVEGATSGDTRLAVSPAATALQSYKYKTGTSLTLPALGDALTTGWTAWDGDADITATTGQQIMVALITTATNACVRAGIATIRSLA